MNKKGISAVVANVLIVLLVVSSVAIIWAVVRPTIEQSGDGIGAEQFLMNLKIENIELSPGENVKVTVKRRAGDGELADLKVIIFDGTDTRILSTNEGIGELETKTYTLPYDGLVKKVSIAPVFDSSGEEKLGNPSDEIEFSNREVMKNHGAIAWWRFEGNADDEVGENDGTINGNVYCEVSGRFGKGCDFDESDNQDITVNSFINEELVEFTTVAWVKHTDSYSNPRTTILDSWNEFYEYKGFVVSLTDYQGEDYYDFCVTNPSENNHKCMANECAYVPENEWYQIVARFNQGIMTIFIDGDVECSLDSGYDTIISSHNNLLRIGYGGINQGRMNGIIDEVMIFDRALTEEEVQDLYNLDYS
jgi:hypothetical protein